MNLYTAIATILSFALLKPSVAGRCDNPQECLSGEAPTTIIPEPWKARCERMLFITPDDIVRYVFLTNGRFDGDRSAAIYHAPEKTGSLSGVYWLTTTEASGSLGGQDARAL